MSSPRFLVCGAGKLEQSAFTAVCVSIALLCSQANNGSSSATIRPPETPTRFQCAPTSQADKEGLKMLLLVVFVPNILSISIPAILVPVINCRHIFSGKDRLGNLGASK